MARYDPFPAMGDMRAHGYQLSYALTRRLCTRARYHLWDPRWLPPSGSWPDKRSSTEAWVQALIHWHALIAETKQEKNAEADTPPDGDDVEKDDRREEPHLGLAPEAAAAASAAGPAGGEEEEGEALRATAAAGSGNKKKRVRGAVRRRRLPAHHPPPPPDQAQQPRASNSAGGGATSAGERDDDDALAGEKNGARDASRPDVAPRAGVSPLPPPSSVPPPSAHAEARGRPEPREEEEEEEDAPASASSSFVARTGGGEEEEEGRASARPSSLPGPVLQPHGGAADDEEDEEEAASAMEEEEEEDEDEEEEARLASVPFLALVPPNATIATFAEHVLAAMGGKEGDDDPPPMPIIVAAGAKEEEGSCSAAAAADDAIERALDEMCFVLPDGMLAVQRERVAAAWTQQQDGRCAELLRRARVAVGILEMYSPHHNERLRAALLEEHHDDLDDPDLEDVKTALSARLMREHDALARALGEVRDALRAAGASATPDAHLFRVERLAEISRMGQALRAATGAYARAHGGVLCGGAKYDERLDDLYQSEVLAMEGNETVHAGTPECAALRALRARWGRLQKTMAFYDKMLLDWLAANPEVVFGKDSQEDEGEEEA